MYLSSSVIHRLSSLPLWRTGSSDTSLPCFRELGLVVMVLTLVTWNKHIPRVVTQYDKPSRRKAETHPGLSSNLQTVLQSQLVTLGSYDWPDKTTITFSQDFNTKWTHLETGRSSSLWMTSWCSCCFLMWYPAMHFGKNVWPAHSWYVSPEAASSVSRADFDGINQHRVTLQNRKNTTVVCRGRLVRPGPGTNRNIHSQNIFKVFLMTYDSSALGTGSIM